MSVWSRIKSIAGGDRVDATVVNPADHTFNVPDSTNLVYLTGSDTGITALVANSATRNRIVYFVQDDTGSTVFTNTNGATVANTMDLGGSNITLGEHDVLGLLLKSDGTWLRLFSANN
jgi:hypothetical protein